MPRKSRKQAGSQTAERQKTRWRYLLRNLDFQKDLESFHKLQRRNKGELDWINACEQVADKWGLVRIPGEIIIYWPGVPLEPEDYPSLEQYWSQFDVSVDYSPVASTEIRDDRFLFFRVDLNHPVQDLLPLIEEELREQTHHRRRKRTRADKVDFHLQVFDMASTGRTFRAIARVLSSRVSTVKSAYLSASSRIFGSDTIPSKYTLVERRTFAGFDEHTHMQECGLCKAAKTQEEFCKAALRYANQDYVSQETLTRFAEQYMSPTDVEEQGEDLDSPSPGS